MRQTMHAAIQYLTSKELAARWKISVWSVNHLAKHRRIRGAVKPGRDWRFPEDAELLPAPTGTPAVLEDPDAVLTAFLKRLDSK
jgi:hypothetical protein